MRCRNKHTARLDRVAPGAEGNFDPSNRSVKRWLARGMLEPLEPMPEATPESSVAESPEAAIRMRGRLTALVKERDELATKVTELEGLLALATAPAQPAAPAVSTDTLASHEPAAPTSSTRGRSGK